MEKHCESKKRFGKEGTTTAASKDRLEEFIRDSSDRAYQVAYSMAGNAEDAKELVQETLYRVTLAWERFDGSRELGAWFFAILRNTFMDSMRQRERKQTVSLDRPVDGEDGPSFGALMAEKGEGILRQAMREEVVKATRERLQQMDRGHQQILALCDMDGLSYEEIAYALRLPVGTVRSRIHRARQAFRTMWPEMEALA